MLRAREESYATGNEECRDEGNQMHEQLLQLDCARFRVFFALRSTQVRREVDGNFVLTPRGKLLADSVAEAFI